MIQLLMKYRMKMDYRNLKETKLERVKSTRTVLNSFFMVSAIFWGMGISIAEAGFCQKNTGGQAPEIMESRLHPAGVSMRSVSVGSSCRVKWAGAGTYSNGAGVGHYNKITATGSIQVSENWFTWTGNESPLLIDFQRNGFLVSPHGTGVHFDINGDGVLDSLQWVADGSDDGFVVRDINFNGYVDNGAELFGIGTDMVNGNGKATDGYQALSQFDSAELGGNDDGVISNEDAVWEELSIWIDSNGDGISVPDEVTAIDKTDVLAMPLNYNVKRNRVDKSGNWIPFWSWVKTDDPSGPGRVRMVDIFFLSL